MCNLTILKTSSVPRSTTKKYSVRCHVTRCPRPLLSPWEVLSLYISAFSTLPHETTLDQCNASTTLNRPRAKILHLVGIGEISHRETEPNARRRIIRFVITFRALIFNFSLTATLITAGYITVRNERLIFCTFTVSEGNSYHFSGDSTRQEWLPLM